MTVAAYVSPLEEPISILRGINPAQVEESPGGTVYLIHLDRPFKLGGFTFRHYIGWSSHGHLARRMIEHRTGSRGSRFLRMARAAGCTWRAPGRATSGRSAGSRTWAAPAGRARAAASSRWPSARSCATPSAATRHLN
ncbi:MAG: hypothetical protein JWM19_845 [Actinomycetia bacterium]|nr:hypothetical protein [Actinomycetes bacterium]